MNGDIKEDSNSQPNCYLQCEHKTWTEKCCEPSLVYNPLKRECSKSKNMIVESEIGTNISPSSDKSNEDVGLSSASTSNSTTLTSTTVTLSTATYDTTAVTSTHQLDECEMKGSCNSLSDFLPLGKCENCYCRCSANSITTMQWIKLCCPPNLVFNPEATPNPNACDTKDHIPECSISKSIHKLKFGVQLYFFLLFVVAKCVTALQ